jgi:hypothetical protein
LPHLPASTKNARHWATFEEAFAAYRDNSDIAGIGFGLDKSDGLVCADFDHCVQHGKIRADVSQVITECETYAEVSPSGHGIRMVAIGTLNRDFSNQQAGVEMYAGNGARYLTFTGHLVEDYQIEDCQDNFVGYAARWDIGKQPDEPGEPAGDCPALPDSPPDLSRVPAFTLEIINGDYSAYGGDRSDALFGVCKDLVKAGYADADILYIVTDPRCPIHEVAFDRRKNNRASQMQWVWEHNLQKARRQFDGYAEIQIDWEAIVANAEKKQAKQEAERQELAKAKARISLGENYVRASSLDGLRFDRTWLVEDWIEAGRFYQFFGEWKSGKTLAVIDMCAHLSLGRKWGERRTVQSLVIYVAGESEIDIQMRYAAWRLHNQLHEETPFFIRTKPVYLTNDQYARQLAEEIKEIHKEYAALPLVIVIDTVARNFGPGKDENGEGMADFSNNIIDHVVRPLNAAVIAVHHTGHGEKGRARGGSTFPAALDGSVQVTKSGTEESSIITVKTKEMRSTAGDEEMHFMIEVQQLPGEDNFGKPIQAPILTPAPDISSFMPNVTSDTKLGKHEKTLITLVENRARKQAEALQEAGYPLHESLIVKQDDIREDFMEKIKASVNTPQARRTTWNREKQNLARHFKVQSGGYIVPIDRLMKGSES